MTLTHELKRKNISQKIFNLIEGCENIYRFNHADTILLHTRIMVIVKDLIT